MFVMKQLIIESNNSVMNAKYNPIRHIQDENTRHVIMLSLMWMWCGIFSAWTGAIFYFGVSVFFHALLFFGLLVTIGTFQVAKRYEIVIKKQ